MSKIDFIDYQNEYAKFGIGELLYRLIITISQQIVPHYPSTKYFPFCREWDENTVREVAHEFIISWLLETDRLKYHLFSQSDSESFEKILRGELRRFMSNNRQKNEFNNLFRRVKKMLQKEEEFRSFGKIDRNSKLWGLDVWDETTPISLQHEILEVMWGINLPPLIKYRLDSAKTSHLLSEQTLHYLLIETFTNLKKMVDMVTLMRAITYRLGLTDIIERSFNETISSNEDDLTFEEYISAPDISMDEQLSISELAKDIYEMLTNRQRKVLGNYLVSQNGTLKEVSETLNISKSTIHNELKIIEQIISSKISEDEGENVFAKLLELCLIDNTTLKKQIDEIAGTRENL